MFWCDQLARVPQREPVDLTPPGMWGDVEWCADDHFESFWVDFERSLHLWKDVTVLIYSCDRMFKTHFCKWNS